MENGGENATNGKPNLICFRSFCAHNFLLFRLSFFFLFVSFIFIFFIFVVVQLVIFIIELCNSSGYNNSNKIAATTTARTRTNRQRRHMPTQCEQFQELASLVPLIPSRVLCMGAGWFVLINRFIVLLPVGKGREREGFGEGVTINIPYINNK